MKIEDVMNEINSNMEKYEIENRISRIYELDSNMTSYDHDVLEKKVVAQLAAVQYIVSFVLDVFGKDFVEIIHELDRQKRFYYHKISVDSLCSIEDINGYRFLEKVEDLKDTEGERLFGQYYTPENIVETIIKLTKIDYEKLPEKKLIDPSCGAGIFYLKIIDLLIMKKKALPIILSIVRNAFWGYDIDEVSLFLTKLCICVHLKAQFAISNCDVVYIAKGLNDHFINTNTLLDDTYTFDYVIGNPPYFKIKDSKSIKNKYKDYINGQSNAYALFLIWALNNVNQKGKICFIIPQSIRNGRYFELIRGKLSQFNIKNIYYLDTRDRKKIFKDVEQAVMIIAIEKNHKKSHTKVFVNKSNYVTEGKFFQTDIISQERFLIPESEDILNIVSILDRYLKFKDIEKDLVFGNGLFVWNQKKKELNNEGNNLPIIYANYIRRNCFHFSPQKNNTDSARKPFCSPKEKANLIYKGKRILVKRTSSMESFERLKACLIDDQFLMKFDKGYFVENHVNILYKIDNKEEQIDIDRQLYILAYLCSDLANFYISQTNGNTQVSANELNNLPFCIVGVDKIIKEMKKASPNWQIINNHFYEAFQISVAQQQIISKVKGEK